MKKKHTHREVTYYPHYSEAKAVADGIAGSRIVHYERGYAIQLRISGPYHDEGSHSIKV